MPVRTITGKVPVKTQREHGQNEVVLKLMHMVLPWLAWAGLTVTGLVLRVGFARLLHLGLYTELLVLALGGTITAFDWHIRRHRAAAVGRLIGPVTAALAALALGLFVLIGFDKALALTWFAGGLTACLVWDIWLTVGDNRDLATTFAAKAEPVGIGGSKLFGVRTRKAGPPGGSRGRASTVTEAGLQLPDGLVVGEVAEDIERMEAALRHPPGSWTVTGTADDAGVGAVKITDPQVLLRGPVPWPGPSAPGLSVAEPFRLGLRQDSEVFLYGLLPSHSVQVTGMSGSAKSMGYGWNVIAEGITRMDYAVVAADVAKQYQFLGPLEPALHLPLAVEPDQAIALLEALRRARLARCNFLARQHMTAWQPGCGLTYLHGVFEEAPDILHLLDRRQMEELWVSLLRNVRSAGMRADALAQRPDHTQVAVVARAQQGQVCFGVADRKDAQLGLSETQKERGARPQLWGASYPGMSVWDTVTVPEADKALPVRLYWWGDDADRIAAHAGEYQARDRWLDDCTGEALAAAPGPSPTSAGRPVGARYDKAAAAKAPPGKPSLAQALEVLRGQVLAWRAEGKDSFTVLDLRKREDLLEQAGRSRSWLYGAGGAMDLLQEEGLVTLVSARPRKKWAIAPAPPEPAPEEET